MDDYLNGVVRSQPSKSFGSCSRSITETGNPGKGASGSSGRGMSSAGCVAFDPEDLSKGKHFMSLSKGHKQNTLTVNTPL